MSRITLILFLITAIRIPQTIAQDTTRNKLSLNGYLSFMESATDINLPDKQWLWESQLHNRLNLHYYPSDNLSFSLQVRSRFLAGDRFKHFLLGDYYRKSLAEDAGVTDLTWNLAEGNSYVLNTSIDRLWVKYARNNIEITAGRQRINWGLTYVWNTNDWFNSFSFFDFDYSERPGSDALRIQYFTGALSEVEAVIKYDSANNFTIAGLVKTNFRGFDFQVLAGMLSEQDAGVGFGWAGGFGKIGFRGEATYLHPLKNMTDTTGLLFFSAALDYTFPNSLMFQVEGFYNQQTAGSEASFTEFYTRPSSIKELSFTELNFYIMAGYPFTPLLNGSMSVLFFPEVKGYYLGPSIAYSLGNNLELAVFMQYFSGEFPDFLGFKSKQEYTMAFGRLKWSF